MQGEYDANAQTLKTKQNKHNRWSRQREKNSNINEILGPKKILKSENIVNLIGGKSQISAKSVLKN
jgi:hypothetical protein